MKVTVELPTDQMYELLLHNADYAGLTIEEYVLFLIKQGLKIVKK